jgi:hypothetical protein
MLSFVLYGCETWYLSWREELSKKVFENRGLKKAFGHKRDEVAGEWRSLHNEELYGLSCSPNVIGVTKSRRMREMVSLCVMNEGKERYILDFGRETRRKETTRKT